MKTETFRELVPYPFLTDLKMAFRSGTEASLNLPLGNQTLLVTPGSEGELIHFWPMQGI